MRQIHRVPKLSPKQQLVETLTWLQILIARGASLERIHETAEQAIRIVTNRH